MEGARKRSVDHFQRERHVGAFFLIDFHQRRKIGVAEKGSDVQILIVVVVVQVGADHAVGNGGKRRDVLLGVR